MENAKKKKPEDLMLTADQELELADVRDDGDWTAGEWESHFAEAGDGFDASVEDEKKPGKAHVKKPVKIEGLDDDLAALLESSNKQMKGFKKPLPIDRPYIDGVLPNGFGILSAPSNGGKTTLFLSWAMSMMTGKPWGGQKAEKAFILYIDAETTWDQFRVEMNDNKNLHKDIERIYAEHGDLPMWHVDATDKAMWNVQKPKDIVREMTKLIKVARLKSKQSWGDRPVYVFLDTRDRLLSRINSAGKETRSKDENEEIGRAFRKVSDDMKIAGLMAHHSGKFNDDQMMENMNPTQLARGNEGVVSQFRLRMAILKRKNDPNGIGMILKNELKTIGVDAVTGRKKVYFDDVAVSFDLDTYEYEVKGNRTDFPLFKASEQKLKAGGKESNNGKVQAFLEKAGKPVSRDEISEGTGIVKNNLNRYLKDYKFEGKGKEIKYYI